MPQRSSLRAQSLGLKVLGLYDTLCSERRMVGGPTGGAFSSKEGTLVWYHASLLGGYCRVLRGGFFL